MRLWPSLCGLLSMVALALVTGCQRAPVNVTTADLNAEKLSAAQRIAEARCDRQTPACEQRAGISYASRDECIAAKVLESARQADLEDCTSSTVDTKKLDECVSMIRREECGTGIKSLAACRREALCRHESEEGTI